MKVDPFDCCSSYNMCSDKGTCVNDQEHKESCTYWRNNLSHGKVFYGHSPGAKVGHIYLLVDGRVFRISKTAKGNSYSMNSKEVEVLLEGLNRSNIEYCFDTQYGECLIKANPEDPAHFRVDFEIDQFEYTVKNYNGYELERAAADKLAAELKKGTNARVIILPGGTVRKTERVNYGPVRETAIVIEPGETQETVKHEPKMEVPAEEFTPLPMVEDLAIDEGYVVEDTKDGKWMQISLFETLIENRLREQRR